MESWISCRWLARFCRSALRSGSLAASPSGAVAMVWRSDHRASRSATRVPLDPSSMSRHRPGRMVWNSSSRSPASSVIFSSRPSAPSFPARRAARLSELTVISAEATAVMRPSSSWASSMTTTSCSGRTLTSDSASMASSAWLVTTTSDSRAVARAISAKHSSPWGQREAPMHSRAVTLTCFHARSGTPGSRSSRSPVSVSLAHSCRRTMCLPSQEISSSPMRASSGSGSRAILFMHR